MEDSSNMFAVTIQTAYFDEKCLILIILIPEDLL